LPIENDLPAYYKPAGPIAKNYCECLASS
jgi:hypothetical protein